MGSSGSKSPGLAQPLRMAPPEQSWQDMAPIAEEIPLAFLGVELPAVPGDIALCGKLTGPASEALAKRFKAWLNLNGPTDPGFFPEDLERCGVQTVVATPFPGPPQFPSEAQLADVLQAIDSLPRPLMLQCTSGNRAGVALMLWLVKKHGYSVEAARQFATDTDIKFFTRCGACGPMRDWLLAQLPSEDAAQVLKPATGLILVQLFDPESSTFTYLLACERTKEAVLIDPVLEQKGRDMTMMQELGLNLRYVLSTHCHADHVTAGGRIRQEISDVKTVISQASGALADVLLADGDRIDLGEISLEALATPGHTDGCLTYLVRGAPSMVFTGDSLLIRGCGRTDFQQGDAGMLYDSIHKKLYALPDNTLVYPGHDYHGRNVSSIGEEKRYNSRLTKSRSEFIKLMSELNLPYPKRIDVALPANLKCGVQDDWGEGGMHL